MCVDVDLWLCVWLCEHVYVYHVCVCVFWPGSKVLGAPSREIAGNPIFTYMPRPIGIRLKVLCVCLS